MRCALSKEERNVGGRLGPCLLVNTRARAGCGRGDCLAALQQCRLAGLANRSDPPGIPCRPHRGDVLIFQPVSKRNRVLTATIPSAVGSPGQCLLVTRMSTASFECRRLVFRCYQMLTAPLWVCWYFFAIAAETFLIDSERIKEGIELFRSLMRAWNPLLVGPDADRLSLFLAATSSSSSSSSSAAVGEEEEEEPASPPGIPETGGSPPAPFYIPFPVDSSHNVVKMFPQTLAELTAWMPEDTDGLSVDCASDGGTEASASAPTDDCDPSECKICFDGAPDAVLLWCGHRSICLGCARTQSTCPFCRSEIVGIWHFQSLSSPSPQQQREYPEPPKTVSGAIAIVVSDS